jgi:hypothetical protein
MFRKLLPVALLPVAIGLAIASPANASGSAHFISHSTYSSGSGSSLVVNFKEAGLSAGATESITAAADPVSTTYECVNGGGKNPSASNKTTTQSAVSFTASFTADKNGNLVGSVTLSAPSASDLGFSCPSGQRTTFVSVSYTNVTLTDNTSGAFAAVAGYSYTNPSAP